MVQGMERRTLIGLVAALGGLAAGTAAALTGSPVLALVTAALALGAGGVCLALSTRLERQEAIEVRLRNDIARLEREVAEGREAVEAADRFAKMVAARELETQAQVEASAAERQRAPLLDEDTGLLDEHYFQVALDHRIAAARRQLQPVTLLLVALDGEGVGDTYRHEAIASFAGTLQETLRDADTACRVGPARFAVIMEDTPEAGGVWAAERLRMAMLRKGGSLLRFSAAVAAYPSHALDASEVLARAQKALDAARASGTSHVEVATTE